MRNSKKTVQLPTDIETMLSESDIPTERLRTSQQPTEGWPDVFLGLSRQKASHKRREVLYCTPEYITDVERLLIDAGVEYRREHVVENVEKEIEKEYRRAAGHDPEQRRKVPTRPGGEQHEWKLTIKIS